MPALFDPAARLRARDRAAAHVGDHFLFDRLFDDLLDRLDGYSRRFGHALLVGAPSPQWPARLAARGLNVTVIEPGTAFATAAGTMASDELAFGLAPAGFDLVIALTTLETIDDLPLLLRRLTVSLAPDSLLIGTMLGGDSLPQLRRTMIALDQRGGGVSPRVHPRIDPQTLAALLGGAGLSMPVIDVERIELRYRSFDALLADLRHHAASNILTARSRRWPGRDALDVARAIFASGGDGERISERLDLLHFAAWSPTPPPPSPSRPPPSARRR